MEFTIVPVQPEPQKKSGDSISEKARAVLWLWLFLAICLWIVAALVPGPALVRLALPPALAGLVACGAGVVLVWTAAVRGWTQGHFREVDGKVRSYHGVEVTGVTEDGNLVANQDQEGLSVEEFILKVLDIREGD